MNSNAAILQVESVCKRFPGVIALQDVDLTLHQGEVLSVVGENGAGKSTLMKILAGIQLPDEGKILLDGVPTQLNSVQEASRAGIALIHQELYLCQNLSVAANIFLGREPKRLGFLDEGTMLREAEKVLSRVGLNISPSALVETLTIGQQQMVEIAKAVSTDARIVIMDEPTSSLSQKESEHLFDIIRTLKAQNVSVIYISHRLGEVELLSDRVVVLRDGQNAGDLEREQINHAAMVERMVGRQLNQFYSRSKHDPGDAILRVFDLRTFAFPECEISFDLREGEIVGLAGLVGAGRTEVLTTLFGVTPALGGTISVEGVDRDIQDCRTAIRHGIGLVPEDRKTQGVVLPMGIRANTSLPTLSSLSKMGFVDMKRELSLANSMREKMAIRTPHVEQPVKFLSGGNQQKVVIAKWLAAEPKILLMDEPTRGVDVGAKQEIYALMDQLAQKGVAILFVSSDMEEVLGMADRILVMHEGKVSGEIPREQFSEEAVMNLATGAIHEESINESMTSTGHAG